MAHPSGIFPCRFPAASGIFPAASGMTPRRAGIHEPARSAPIVPKPPECVNQTATSRAGASGSGRGGAGSGHARQRRARLLTEPGPDLVSADIVEIIEDVEGLLPRGPGHRLIPDRTV